MAARFDEGALELHFLREHYRPLAVFVRGYAGAIGGVGLARVFGERVKDPLRNARARRHELFKDRKS